MNVITEKDTILAKFHKRELIINQLRKKKFRITEQRRLLIDVILEDECSSCKEIYYKAVKKDSTVGIATVYRMVKTLEDLGVINRKNLYQIDYKNLNLKEEQVLFVDGETDKTVRIKKGLWFTELQKTLAEQGIEDIQNITVLIKNQRNDDDCCEEDLYNACGCQNTACKYHCKKRDKLA
ncbi:transcriptional repressor [Anaerocolumna xylanovorans]|uniref:Fur family transcriptional regulator, ferric uptake regulator n=1 Tax=Anaerocolumna xylanovorans DSM 12503 TaxID=1121345 RepID=A0A1M7Y0T9_9FIRM|nr:transcriptional repressor [Anaerocolumna xylanovorans]SHO44999.1 Fur family transcriptional regulator, ferric uptake regulator [Anaerocolumna xylanovorans DSM 12503]